MPKENDIESLVLMKCPEVSQRLALEKDDIVSETIIITSCHPVIDDVEKSWHDYQKINSQQGWKKLPKHKR